MYAIISTGNKQYKVSKDNIITVDKLSGDEGSVIEIQNVLLFSDGDKTVVGAPVVEGCVIKAEIVKQFKDDKIIVFKKKRRQNYRRKKGHRQQLTNIKITEIKIA